MTPRQGALATYALALALGGLAGRHLAEMIPHAVTAAAALAGLIPYPPEAVTLQLAQDGKTLLEAALVQAMGAGLTIAGAARLVMALQGALYCGAAALLIHALSRRVLPAAAGGLFFLLVLPYAGGIAYSDYIIAALAPPTNGILALGLSMTVAAFMAQGWLMAAALGLGLAVLIHPVIGLCLAGLAAIGLWLARAELDPATLRRTALAAALCVGAALVIAALRGPALGGGDPRLLAAYFELWDYHRNVELSGTLVLMTLQVAAISALGWALRGPEPGQRLFTAYLAAAGAAGVVLYFSFHAARDVLPPQALMLMPNRLVNLALALGFPVLAGLALRRGWDAIGVAVLAVLVAGPFAAEALGLFALQPVLALALAGALFLSRGKAVALPALPRLHPALPAGLALAALAWGASLEPREMNGEDEGGRVLARQIAALGGPVMAANAKTALLLGSLAPSAPLALNIAELDFMPYFPRSIPRIAEILAEVYGVDFADPPPATRNLGALTFERVPFDREGPTPNRALWEGRSREEWRELGLRYGFSGVATPGRWRLNLPNTTMINVSPDQSLRVWRLPK